MKVVSLFDWCSCAFQALKNAGIQVDLYYSSEVDKYAKAVSKKNHSTIDLWDVNFVLTQDWQSETMQNINFQVDLLIGWPPCQDLSIAGKRAGLEWERSGLFWQFARIKRKLKPKRFIMENVASMSKEARDTISKELWVEPIMINSALVTAQNRKRLYWTNIPGVVQPEDRGILLKDIILDQVDEKYYVTDLKVKQSEWNTSKECIRIWHFNTGWQGDRIYSVEWKSVTLSALWGWRWAKTWLYKVGNVHPSGKWMNWNVYAPEWKSPTITTNKGEWIKIVQRGHWFNKWWEHHDKYPTLSVWSWIHNNHLHEWDRIRKLTPIECERLQWLPDDYTAGVSNSQRYKMIGNGFTVPVIEHILSFLPKECLQKKTYEPGLPTIDGKVDKQAS